MNKNNIILIWWDTMHSLKGLMQIHVWTNTDSRNIGLKIKASFRTIVGYPLIA